MKHIDIVAIRNGPQLKDTHGDNLIGPVTRNIKSIDDSKKSGIDGYTSKFFKSTWKITRGVVLDAVQDFFVRNRLIAMANCALVTLIPKTSEAKRIKDMRPIACCSIIFKVISKILTLRLSRIINEIIDES
ncbi:unnamed protein product [Vicia faba]|uniref:Uncharacterized protein n=1 Tax=Vicia faba TaxID=3906 RepID=A0AAV0Z3F5_VICFA|nr:unnamed protein product [Vicia faba]